jgi:hypothetical protein
MKTLLALLLLIPSLSWGDEINLLCIESEDGWEGMKFDIDINLEKEMLWDDNGNYYVIIKLTDKYLYAFRDSFKRKVEMDRSTGEGRFYNTEGGILREYSFQCRIKSNIF